MPSTAEASAQKAGEPDEATIQGWSGLLESLDQDELVRYGQIALDQYHHEMRYWWAQSLLVAMAVTSVFFAVRGLTIGSFARLGFFTLGLPALLSYWPYRSAKTRKLWWGHYTAVLAEQERRGREPKPAASAAAAMSES